MLDSIIRKIEDIWSLVNMKICIVTSGYPPKIGGVETVTENLAKEYVNLMHEVHVITPSEDATNQTITPENIILHKIHIDKFSDAETMPIYNKIPRGILFFRSIFKNIKKIKPDIIHVQNIQNSIPVYFAKKIQKTPYCIALHNNLELMGIALPNFMKKYWMKLPYVKDANAIVSLTKEMAETVQESLQRDSYIIPNGVDMKRFYPNPAPNKERENKIILTISRLDNKKGIEYAIESMPNILKKYPHTILRIIGDGDFKPELDKITKSLFLQNSVDFIGWIPNIDVPNYLQNADIFLLPSLSEGFSLTAIEASACGLPIVSTPVGIVPDIIDKWNNGIIVPFKSPEAISDAVITLLSNPDLKETYAKNSATAAKETMSWKSVAEQYISLYQSIIDSN